jgi:predicted DNA-binding transcriptional regulator AlpA
MPESHTQFNNSDRPTKGFIRERQLRRRVPVAHSTLWKWVRDGKFPPPLKLSDRVTVWRLSDVDAWEAMQGQA